MIVYKANKADFLKDVDTNHIEEMILAAMKNRFGTAVGKAEVSSWQSSLSYMHRILATDEIPNNAGVAVEFVIPRSQKRIDFMLTGWNEASEHVAVIIELKQWQDAQITEKDGIVKTFIGGMHREMPHPSYQAWSYACLLEDFNEAVRNEPIRLKPCTYLHNCSNRHPLENSFYDVHTKRAPLFIKSDAERLRRFIRDHVKRGDGGETLYRIDNGSIRPSKSLSDALSSLLFGKDEFVLIDDQKLVYETAALRARTATSTNKRVVIVEGGPGTGKSVVAINLMVKLTADGQVVQYVTKNAAPRTVFESKLVGQMSKSRFSNMFTGSGSYHQADPNIFDTLVVDEAHRLTAKSGMFQNKGENQVMELIRSAKCAIFFIDEDQRVTFKDVGTKAIIRKYAEQFGASVEELKLETQFRCNGSDGYLAWVNNTLQIGATANEDLDGNAYEFKVFDSPKQLRAEILNRNAIANRARLVAGYCWEWPSKKSPTAMDIVLPACDFQARWNLSTDGNLWILKPESVNEVGCIHTCQGLEVDYIGVILGPDLIVRDGVVITDATKRARSDASVKGYKTMHKKSPADAEAKAAMVIKNTYRTLMTRGQKGCFIHSIDPETNEYFRSKMGGKKPS